jgi:hypothetical protein
MGERLSLQTEVVTYNVGRLPAPRLHQYPLKGQKFRNAALGESVIVKFRKLGLPVEDYERG